MEHTGGAEPAGAAALPLGDGEAHRLDGAQALAVLAEALHIQDLVEGQGRLRAVQRARLVPPGAARGDLPLGHRLAAEQLQLLEAGAAAHVQDGGGGLAKGHLAVGGDQLVKDGGPLDPAQGGLPLLDAAVGQGGNHLGAALGKDGRHQPVGPPHLDAAGVDGPAVDVLGLPLDGGAPGGEGERGQVERPAEGQLLLGLAQPRPVLPLVVDGAAEVALQRQPPRLQLLLQHHRPHEALDHLEHLRQVVRDEDLGLDRDLRLDGAAPAPGIEDIAENFQFHRYGAPFLSLDRCAWFTVCARRAKKNAKRPAAGPFGRPRRVLPSVFLFDAEHQAQQAGQALRAFDDDHLHMRSLPFSFAPL